MIKFRSRTTNKLPYKAEGIQDGAHDKAIELEKSLPNGDIRKSKAPGEARTKFKTNHPISAPIKK